MPADRKTACTTRRRRSTSTAVAVTAVLCGFTLTACQGGSSPGPAGRTPTPPSAPSAPSAPGGDPAAPTPTLGAGPSWDTAPDSLAAVGDSLTTAFDACGPLAECPRASWATGTEPSVGSLARRLLERPSKDSWNLAESGATMADLPQQMARAAARRPGLVTVLMGANDACRPSVGAMTPVPAFRSDFTEALRALWEEAPKAQVYVASVPDLKRLWEVGRQHPDARRAWEFGICPSMLRAPQATGDAAVARRARVADRVRAYNAVLRETCTADRRCRWDGGAVHDHRFTSEALSGWDWFHPSREGQSELAELAHRRITDG
jgi:lysophospholipase L1-like esterase